MFRCSAKCCDNMSLNQTDMQRCLETCSAPAQKADHYMQTEMQDMQDRFQRCAMACADKVKDMGESNSQKNRAAMEACVAVCGDEMLRLLPTYTTRMREWFNRKTYEH